MEPCELYENWHDIAGTSEQLDGLEELVNSITEAWGLEGVTVDFGEVDGDDYAEYDPNTNHITIDLDGLDNPDEAFNTVFHESMHAVHAQWGFSDEEMEALHDFVDESAGFLGDELLADCVSTDPVESGWNSTIPDIPGTINIIGGGPE